jgi:hypothetical protein
VTLGEVLIATAITLSILGSVFAAIAPAPAAFATQQERVDLQQRLRVAVEAIAADLRAGSAVRPYRTGASGDDGLAGVFFRGGVLTVRFAAPPPGGPPVDRSHTYSLRRSGETTQLVRYDGGATSLPVLDDIVGLDFEYFGTPHPPAIVAGDDGFPRATYGPTPPALDVDDVADRWGPGENCTFAVVSGVRAARLTSLGGRDDVRLGEAMLTDGPWCPDAGTADRFDADLLRVHRVRVRLRAQAPSPFRGPAGPFFLNSGSAADVRRHVPDAEVLVDVTLRNWNAEW